MVSEGDIVNIEEIKVIPHAYELARTITDNKADSKIMGSSLTEIEKLEKEMQLEFPRAFREYLMCFGGDEGGEYSLFSGSDPGLCFVKFATEVLLETLNEENQTPLEDTPLICFFSHQGYNFLYFHVNGDDNPMCYNYKEIGKDKKTGLPVGGISQFVRFDEVLIKLLKRGQGIPMEMKNKI